MNSIDRSGNARLKASDFIVQFNRERTQWNYLHLFSEYN